MNSSDSSLFGSSLFISSLMPLPSVPALTVALGKTQCFRDEYDGDECEEEGEDLLNDNFMDDYRRMDEQDQYDPVGLDESFEDDMDTDQVIQDRRVPGLKLEARDVCLFKSEAPSAST